MTTAVVTGAARGVGRGIAEAFGAAGHTVHVADRESRARRFSELPGTVEDTAETVTAAGGVGIAHPLDVGDDDAVAALFAGLATDGLDVVVANACDGNALPFAPAPFWELPVGHWHNMLTIGVRSHLVTATHALPALRRRGGLLVLTGLRADDDATLGHVYYDLAMRSVSRLVETLHRDAAAVGVAVTGLSPGFTATEAIEAALGPAPAGADPLERVGRAALRLLDAPRDEVGGRVLTVAELAPA